MKKTAFLLLVLAALQLAFLSLKASEVTAAKTFTVSSKSADAMDIRFNIPSYEIEKETIGGEIWDKINLVESGFLMETGLPELPVLSTAIAIPNHGQVSLEVINTRTKMIEHIMPYPSQTSSMEDNPKNLSINRSFYDGSGIYPQEIVQCSEPQILRDFRIVTIQMQPFAWNASTKELEVREEVNFRLHFTNEPGINELEGPQIVSSAFEHIYESVILNFDDYRNYIVPNAPPRYLIIYGNSTDNSYLTKVNDFAFWKKQKGADLRLVSTAVTGTTTTAIKNYIQSLYNDINSRPDYIVLIGDVSGSFPIPSFTESWSGLNGHGDYPYTHLAGNDYLGDVFIGRISVENTSQLDVVLSKTYFYEKNINVATAQWLQKMLLVGDTNPSGAGLYYTMKNIRDLALMVNPDYTFTELYGDPSASSMNSAINQGVGFFWYRGWIGMSGWSPSSSLINGAKLPHAILITCSTGNFYSGEATTEQFVRSIGTASVPAGAVTAIGMETSHTNPMCNNILVRGMANGIFANHMRTMGEAMLNGKILGSVMYGQNHTYVMNYSNHWCNLIGDPTMEVFCKIPDTFACNAPDSLSLGTSYLDLNIINQNAQPIEGACVTISQGNIILGRGYTDASGRVLLYLINPLASGSAVVTVSKHDCKPLQKTVTISENGSLVAWQPIIDDDNTGSSIGNGNNEANSGETLELIAALKNTASATLNAVTGYATTASSYATILNDSLNFGNIEAGATNYTMIPLLVQISPSCPHNTTVRFDLHLTDANNHSYAPILLLTITDAFMTFVSYQIQDENNQALDPDESAQFIITLNNNGSVPVSGLYGQLATQNDLVLVQDNIGYFGDIEAGAQVSCQTDSYQLLGRTQLLPGMLIPLRLRLYNAAGFQQWLDFTLTVGSVTSTDPVGPDAHGYVIYDITDTSYEDCPTYSWIGVAPSEGGQGTLMPFTDTSVDLDGDNTDVTSCIAATLPFNFTFYGKSYSQITVCSNGFIAMGLTDNGNWANTPIPGYGGPNYLIAPFWDDLIIGSGGVYKWFDSVNHLFVVEWYNLKNGFNQSSIESFEVILYDPLYYPTSLGDGPIKIQYQTFNNVDNTWAPTSLTVVSGSGNYATVGIQDLELGTGLQYSFNNLYPTAAAPLGNSKALYITNAPVYHYTPHLMYDSYFVRDNNNNVAEPNETVDLYVNLLNIGEQEATGINAQIISTSPYVTIGNAVSSYASIAGNASGTNLTPFVISVSADCPDNQILPFTLNITSDTNFWTRHFNLTVEKPSLSYESYIINDASGNNNGVAEPGETVVLAVNIKNTSEVDAHDLIGTLTTTSPGVTIFNQTVEKNLVKANEILQLAYYLVVDITFQPGTEVNFNLSLISQDAPPVNTTIPITLATPGLILDFEANNGFLNSLSGWACGTPTQTTPHSGNNVWATNLTGQYDNNAMYILETPPLTIGTNATLTFWHMMSCQNFYDGGNLSISTNGGSMWSVLYPVGGYNTSFSIYSLGEQGYTNNVSWSQAIFNLSNYAGTTAVIRWRFASNGSVQGNGWFIDDVMISGYYITPGLITGNVTLNSNFAPSQVHLITDNMIAATPNANGIYALYLPQGSYTLTANMPYHICSQSPSFTLADSVTSYNFDFSLTFLANPTDLNYTLAVGDSIVHLFWGSPINAPSDPLGYNVYRKIGVHPYHLLGLTTELNYTDQPPEDGVYDYCVKAIYPEGEGAPSNMISVTYPNVGNGNQVQEIWLNTLQQNFPNPFTTETTFYFSLAAKGHVAVKIYNAKGQLVKTLLDETKASGQYHIRWDGKDASGKTAASGIYFCRMTAPGFSKTRKMLLVN